MEKEDDETKDMLSVVLSTYNRSDRLRKAIKSVVDQTYPDWELVVVDDNSKDNTEAVVESFKDDRIKYIKRTKNFGNDTRPKNEGVMASRGEYIAFLDDDNQFRPDHLAILLKEIEKDDKFDVVYGDRWLIDETKKIKPQVGVSMDFNEEVLMKRNFIDTSDVLMKRSAIFDVGGWDERYRKYVDWNLWVRMAKFGKRFNRVPMVITDYFLHPKMKSLTVKDRNKDGSASVPLGNSPVFNPEWNPYDLEVELPYLGNEVKEPRVAVFTLTYDRLDYTKKSFASLKKTAGYPYDHFVVDNGSKDGTVEYLKKGFKRVQFNENNEGISKASNDAIKMIKNHNRYDIVVKWDNDCTGLTKGWLAKMIEIWKSNRIFALSCYVQGLVDNPGGSPRIGFGTIKGELIGISRHLGGICHFIDAKAYDKFEWDEKSFLHGVQDREFSQYTGFRGYSMGYLENFFVSHGPLGTEQQKKDYPKYFERRKKEKRIRYETTHNN